jgi:hypothetical protein
VTCVNIGEKEYLTFQEEVFIHKIRNLFSPLLHMRKHACKQEQEKKRTSEMKVLMLLESFIWPEREVTQLMSCCAGNSPQHHSFW